MDLFDLGRVLHSAAGVAALASFWTAALARKGGRIHRRAGRIYLISLIVVMLLSTLMVVGRAVRGEPGVAVFLAFLISLVGAASWLMWGSIRYRRDPARLVNGAYRGLASWLIVAGLAMFALGVSSGVALRMFLSLVGIGFGVNMWRLALAADRGGRWWLAQHMNGVALNFIATHDSFIALGLGSIIPEIRASVPRMLVAVSVTVVAIGVRVWAGRQRAWRTAI
jgi:hypothetical protein